MTHRMFSRRSFFKAAAGLLVAQVTPIEPIQRFFPLDRTMIQKPAPELVMFTGGNIALDDCTGPFRWAHVPTFHELPGLRYADARITPSEFYSISEDEFLQDYYVSARFPIDYGAFEPDYISISSHEEDGVQVIDEAHLLYVTVAYDGLYPISRVNPLDNE